MTADGVGSCRVWLWLVWQQKGWEVGVLSCGEESTDPSAGIGAKGCPYGEEVLDLNPSLAIGGSQARVDVELQALSCSGRDQT